MQNIKQENEEQKTHIKEIIDNQDNDNNDTLSEEINSYKIKMD